MILFKNIINIDLVLISLTLILNLVLK